MNRMQWTGNAMDWKYGMEVEQRAYNGAEQLAHRVDLPEHLIEPELVRCTTRHISVRSL